MVGSMSEIPPSDHSRMRASDADRDSVAHRLREALAEGRLDPDEHSERLDAVYRAKTLGELVPLTEDLPAPNGETGSVAVPTDFHSPRPVYAGGRITSAGPTSRLAIAIMGGADRAGSWVVPKQFFTAALMGGVELDLREAHFTSRETSIWVGAVMGGVEIRVPDDVQVRVHGLPIMGGFSGGLRQPSTMPADAPIVHIRGLAVMGGVEVKYRRRAYQREEDED
ncbi:DUF1707 domain-containing protein [Nocardiopsis sp. CNT312]|uniref:DUF1707 SHOCT-like domain-containing protein n=1 Tax=Nocardiopsis sp. CNT312 TaxID=1137268 RepID=UPI00048B0D46|nr:DUF1707 domain-containing protein [Nocardiopsis sp. CNT312]